MDCITCHNRITHLVAAPENTVDKLIAADQISKDIPDIRRQAVEAYSKIYTKPQADGIGRSKIIPDLLSGVLRCQHQKIRQAMAVCRILRNSVYPSRTRLDHASK
jgi:hypothetical protein